MAKKKADADLPVGEAELEVKPVEVDEDTNADEAADAGRKGKKDSPMVELIKNTASLPGTGDVIEGPVIALGRAKVFVDLHPFGTGSIYGR